MQWEYSMGQALFQSISVGSLKFSQHPNQVRADIVNILQMSKPRHSEVK